MNRGLTISRFGRFRFLFPSIFASPKRKSLPPRFRFRFRGSNYHQKIFGEAGGRFPFPAIPVFASSLQVPPRAARCVLDGCFWRRAIRVRSQARSVASSDLGTFPVKSRLLGAAARRKRAHSELNIAARATPMQGALCLRYTRLEWRRAGSDIGSFYSKKGALPSCGGWYIFWGGAVPSLEVTLC